MSRNIPEVIVPSNLLVPTINDQFSIISGGMPNGDSCLRINGSADTNHSAYQDPAEGGLGDLVNTDRNIAFWFRVVSGLSAFDESTIDQMLWSKQGQRNGSNRRSESIQLWNDRIRVQAWGNSSSRYTDAVVNLSDGEWHFVVTSLVGGTAPSTDPELYLDLIPHFTSGVGGGTGLTTGTATYVQRVGIGNAMPDINTAYQGVDGIVDIGKLSYFSSPLTSDQRLALWDAMWGT